MPKQACEPLPSREQMLMGTPGKGTFIFPHSLPNRISDQGHKYWFAFYWNSVLSFQFSRILPLSFRAFYLSFLVCSTYLSQNVSFLATRWGRMYDVLLLKSKLSPRWKLIWPSHSFLDLARFLERAALVFCGKLHWRIVPWSTQWRVHGLLWDRGSIYERL